MQLTLEKITGYDNQGKELTEEKTYVVDHLKARMVRRALEIYNSVNLNNMEPEDLDTMVNYVVEVYNKQFTVDDVYDGIEASELISTITKCINDVVGTMGAKLEKMPKNQ